ncbi:MAG TPA: class I SAM-dependent methyltransferase [Solirubrobacteraceae bacterium]|nr:class I SAM-dependent methyltransferase [Solirubrobacteraceae bacterium]
MEPARSELLSELFTHGRAHDAELADRHQRLRNVEPETAALMAVLVRALAARRLLELGTSNGYSTIWLGDAAESHGGRVLSVDLDPGRAEQARENIARAGLGDVVELRLQDAGEALAGLPDEGADFIFMDAERTEYVSYWEHLLRVLARPGLLVVDNAISHAEEMAAFRALAEGDERASVALVSVGAGVLVISRA